MNLFDQYKAWETLIKPYKNLRTSYVLYLCRKIWAGLPAALSSAQSTEGGREASSNFYGSRDYKWLGIIILLWSGAPCPLPVQEYL